MKKYLVVSPWNNGTGNARFSKMFCQQKLNDNHQIVVLGAGSRDEWVEEFTPSKPENFRFHESGEQIHIGGELFENPGLEPADYVICQIMVYLREYSLDKLVLIGGFYELFEILARLRTLVENDPFLKTKSIQVFVRNKFKKVIVTEEKYRLAYNSDNLFPHFQICSNVNLDSLHLNTDVKPFITRLDREFSSKNTRTIAESRRALLGSMGFNFPEHTKIFLTCNLSFEQLRAVLHGYFLFMSKQDSNLIRNDSFFLFVHDTQITREKKVLIKNHAFENYICVGEYNLPTPILIDLYDSCNVGIHMPGSECRIEHDSRRRSQILCDSTSTAELTVGNEIYEIPEPEMIEEQMNSF